MEHQTPFNFSGCFIINDDFIFTSERREVMQKSTRNIAILQTPASRCFLLLLNNHGMILNQSSLIKFAWGEKIAPSITSNAFYQTISYLRKTLKDIGCEDLITTVPRLGLTINSSIKIQLVNDNENSVDDVGVADVINSDLDILTTSPVIPPPKELTLKKKQKYNIPQLTLLGGSLFFTIASFFLIPNDKKTDPLLEYKTTGLGNCLVNYSGTIDTNKIADILKKNMIPCEEKNTIYLTTTNKRDSFITCKFNGKNHRDCNVLVVVKG